MPKISVVIPLYNKAFSIKKTLTSVLKQTFTDFEIIVINDGSTDNSVEIVQNFTDKKVYIYSQENKGAAVARNLGIEKANGELIAFLDADDLWETNHLEELYNLYHDFPDCGLYCSRYQIQLSKQKIQKAIYINIFDDFRGIIPDYFESSMKNRVGLTSALAIPKEVLAKHQFNPKVSSGQDLELFTKIAIQFPVAITDKITVLYDFSSTNQLSKTKITQKTLPNFSQFAQTEKENKSLKKFLDLYRIEYGLHFRVYGELKKSGRYLEEVTSKIPFKTKLLLKLPPFILRNLLPLKHFLRSKGIDFTVYH